MLLVKMGSETENNVVHQNNKFIIEKRDYCEREEPILLLKRTY